MADTFTASERLWDPATGQLAYAAGAKVPTSERKHLVGDAEWDSRRLNYDDVFTTKPAKKTAARKSATKKTASRKTASRRRD